MGSELRMAEYVAAASDAQMRALVAEREALDEWALRLAAAKQEGALRFDSETKALSREREALDTRARHLVKKEALRREVFDSMVRQAFLVDNHQNVGSNTEYKKRKASYLEPASGEENPAMKVISDVDGQPVAKKEKLPQLEKKTPLSERSDWWCDVCKLDCKEANAMAAHLVGKRHKRMVKMSSKESPPSDEKTEMDSLKSMSGIREPSEKEDEASLLEVSKSWCALCEVNCPNLKALLAHQAGKKHLRRMSVESKKQEDAAQEIHSCFLEEGKKVNTNECPSAKGLGVKNPDNATDNSVTSLSKCKIDCVDNGLEKGNLVSLDSESPLATMTMPECKNESVDNGLEKGTCAKVDSECPLAPVSVPL